MFLPLFGSQVSGTVSECEFSVRRKSAGHRWPFRGPAKTEETGLPLVPLPINKSFQQGSSPISGYGRANKCCVQLRRLVLFFRVASSPHVEPDSLNVFFFLLGAEMGLWVFRVSHFLHPKSWRNEKGNDPEKKSPSIRSGTPPKINSCPPGLGLGHSLSHQAKGPTTEPISGSSAWRSRTLWRPCARWATPSCRSASASSPCSSTPGARITSEGKGQARMTQPLFWGSKKKPATLAGGQ